MNKREKLCNEKRFYVYGLYDPKNELPFYIGKGCSYRKTDHFTGSCKGNNTHKDRKIAKIKRQGREPYSKVIFDHLTEAKAYDREWAVIHMLDVHPTVTLTNINYSWGKGVGGGENAPWYGKERSEETIKKIVETKKHKIESGKIEPAKGEDLSNAHTKEEIAEIKWLAKNTNATYPLISEKYDTDPGTICDVKKENNWGHVDSKKPDWYDYRKLQSMMHGRSGQGKITNEKAGEIKWLAHKSDMFQKEIGEKYGVSRTYVAKIKCEAIYESVKPLKPQSQNIDS